MLGFVLPSFVCALLLLHAYVAYSVARTSQLFYSYWFILPHLLALLLSVLAVALDAIVRKRGTYALALACISAPLLTWAFAVLKWPGGDDGPGLAWVYGVGIASLLTTTLGLPLVRLAHRT